MLATYKESEDKNNLIFWASSILNQNDKEELSLTAADIMPVVKDIEKSIKKKNFTDLYKLSTINEQWWIPTLTGQKVKEKVNDYFNNEKNIPYTISFSHNEDKLLMWAMYANNGNGICLAFDENLLVSNSAYRYAIPGSVIYKKDPQSLKKIIKAFYEMYLKELRDNSIINIIYQLKQKYWACILMGISPYIKNIAFEDEAEFRIVYYVAGEKNPPIYTRLTNRFNIINYIKVKIPIVALQYIIIGPCANYKQTRDLLVENMKSCNIVRDSDEDIVRKSQIPYRIF